MRAISFNPVMLAAVWASRKTVTRRRFPLDLLLQQEPERYRYDGLAEEGAVFIDLRANPVSRLPPVPCPFGQPGEQVYVVEDPGLILEIRSIRAEQVQDITEEDALAEGVHQQEKDGHLQWGGVVPDPDRVGQFHWSSRPLVAFRVLLDSIYPTAWEQNQWMWVVTFTQVSV
ncbi:hypothetical protein [Hymenobacter norwichensis]|uniref:hypothetical protein n=1 Tax=Hymenobacter norwichensis TaxID=223903 RepID=UPI0003B7ABB2|nr:hypothetical protein [Hymenobacter norwichensis]